MEIKELKEEEENAGVKSRKRSVSEGLASAIGQQQRKLVEVMAERDAEKDKTTVLMADVKELLRLEDELSRRREDDLESLCALLVDVPGLKSAAEALIGAQRRVENAFGHVERIRSEIEQRITSFTNAWNSETSAQRAACDRLRARLDTTSKPETATGQQPAAAAGPVEQQTLPVPNTEAGKVVLYKPGWRHKVVMYSPAAVDKALVGRLSRKALDATNKLQEELYGLTKLGYGFDLSQVDELENWLLMHTNSHNAQPQQRSEQKSPTGETRTTSPVPPAVTQADDLWKNVADYKCQARLTWTKKTDDVEQH